jgi:hypothetical protein
VKELPDAYVAVAISGEHPTGDVPQSLAHMTTLKLPLAGKRLAVPEATVKDVAAEETFPDSVLCPKFDPVRVIAPKDMPEHNNMVRIEADSSLVITKLFILFISYLLMHMH